jgi:two-component system, sensor histidine kinase and response regulator
MKFLKIRKITNYILARDKGFSLEHRLLVSTILMGIFMGLVGGIVNIFLTTSVIASVAPFSFAVLAIVLYYFARFKRTHKKLPLVVAFVGIIGISIVWVFNGGINGPNSLILLVFLMLGLIIIPDKHKKFVFGFFILINILLMFIHLYKPEIIISYPSEFDRWIDILIGLIFSGISIFIVIRFVHKNYTIERIRAEKNEKKLRIANNNKDRFISVLAHDLKSPFNSLLGLTKLLKENLHKYDIDKIEYLINIVHQSTNQTYNLLEDLLLWSQSKSGNFTINSQNIVFKEVCNEVINYLKHQADAKEITIEFYDHEKTILNADLNMFKIVLRNLISNAIKYTFKNGLIKISIEKNDTIATITVSDNGVGIEKENLSNFWDLKKSNSKTGTSGEKGTGFGLLLCKEFVEKNNGKIWVESEPGKGSNFKFTIPLSTYEKSINKAPIGH